MQKYAFGPDYTIVEKYIPHVEKAASEVIRSAVDTASCTEFCNDSRFDASQSGFTPSPVPSWLAADLMKSAASYGFGTVDPVTSVLESIASGNEPSFSVGSKEKSAEEVDQSVVRKLAKKYAGQQDSRFINGVLGSVAREREE